MRALCNLCNLSLIGVIRVDSFDLNGFFVHFWPGSLVLFVIWDLRAFTLKKNMVYYLYQGRLPHLPPNKGGPVFLCRKIISPTTNCDIESAKIPVKIFFQERGPRYPDV